MRAHVAKLERQIDDLRAALVTREDIARAIGILQERYGLDQEAAFGVLLRVSSQSQTKVRVVAADFLNNGALPDDEDATSTQPGPAHPGLEAGATQPDAS